jgi:hypothetical protein
MESTIGIKYIPNLKMIFKNPDQQQDHEADTGVFAANAVPCMCGTCMVRKIAINM